MSIFRLSQEAGKTSGSIMTSKVIKKLPTFILCLSFLSVSCFENSNSGPSGSSEDPADRPVSGLFGQLVCEDGSPGENARVVIRALSATQTASPTLTTVETSALADSTGVFHIKALDNGLYILTASRIEGGDSLGLYIPPFFFDSVQDLGTRKLQPTGSFVVSIEHDSMPLEDYSCLFPHTPYQAVSSPNGTCIITGVPPGIYNATFLVADSVIGMEADFFMAPGSLHVSYLSIDSPSPVKDTIYISVPDTTSKMDTPVLRAPFPPDNAGQISMPVTMAWDIFPVPQSEGLFFNVYFDVMNPPVKIASRSQLYSFLMMDSLKGDQTYFWKVVGILDSLEIDGPTWQFTTAHINTPPSISSLEPQTVNAAQTLEVHISGTDAENDNISFLLLNPPDGAALDSNIFTWTPSGNQVGEYLISLVALDNGSPPLSVTLLFRVTVNDTDGTGLAAFWDFSQISDTAIDKSGNGLHGTIIGAAHTEDRFGNPASALSLNGVNDYIRVPYDDKWSFGRGDFAVCFWIKSATVKRSAVIDCFNGANNPMGWYVHLNHPSSPLHMHFGDGINSWYSLQADSGIYSDDEWHFISIVKEQSSILLYLDSEIQSWSPFNADSDSITSEVNNPGNPLLFGRGTGIYSKNFLMGSIDDIRIYSRKISDSEIRFLFKN